jgi:hypothetical protein
MPISTLYFGYEPSSSAAELPSEVAVTGLGQKIINQDVDGCDSLPSDWFWKTSTVRSEKIWPIIQPFFLDLK